MSWLLDDATHARQRGSLAVNWGLLLALGGILMGLKGLATGEFYSQEIGSELIQRATDFRNFAWQQQAGMLESLHPYYHQLIDANPSLGPVIVAWLGSFPWGLSIAVIAMTLVYGAIISVAPAAMVYALEGRRAVALMTVFLTFALGFNALIYGYSPVGLTGMLATGLFVFAMSAAVLGRSGLALCIWLVHLGFHLTTAVLWGPLLFIYLFVQSSMGNRLANESDGRWFTIGVLGVAFVVTPISGLAMMLVEMLGAFPVDNFTNYWDLTRGRNTHTLLIGTDRHYLLVNYFGLGCALLFLGFGLERSQALCWLNRTVGAFGLGLFAFAIAFVESTASPLAAIMLPYRFESFMYVIFIVNLVHIALGGRNDSASGRIAALSFLGWLTVVVNGIPLAASWLWAGLQRLVEGSGSRRFSILLVLSLLGFFALHMWLPAGPGRFSAAARMIDWSDPFGPTSAVYSNLANILHIDVINARYSLVFGLQLIPVLFMFAIGWVAEKLDRTVWVVTLSAIALAFVGVTSLERRFPFHSISGEMVAIWKEQGETTPEKALSKWVAVNSLPKDHFLTHPSIFIRRTTARYHSVDFDLLSLFQYQPQYVSKLANELKAVYDIDIHDVAQRRQRVWRIFTPTQWEKRLLIATRDKACGMGFQFALEPARFKRLALTVVYENRRYRIYKLC